MTAKPNLIMVHEQRLEIDCWRRICRRLGQHTIHTLAVILLQTGHDIVVSLEHISVCAI